MGSSLRKQIWRVWFLGERSRLESRPKEARAFVSNSICENHKNDPVTCDRQFSEMPFLDWTRHQLVCRHRIQMVKIPSCLCRRKYSLVGSRIESDPKNLTCVSLLAFFNVSSLVSVILKQIYNASRTAQQSAGWNQTSWCMKQTARKISVCVGRIRYLFLSTRKKWCFLIPAGAADDTNR